MNDLNEQSSIKEIVERILQLLDFTDAEVVVEARESSDARAAYTCNIAIKEDSKYLIGQYGANLQAVQQLASILVRKKVGHHIYFLVDVNAYRAEKNDLIARDAREAGQRAISEKKPIVLRPMRPYERRIVHMTLADDANVITESIGDRDDRKVIVKPRSVI